MSAALRIMLIIMSVGSLGYIVRKIRYSRMQIEYALFWIVLAIIFIVMAVFPQVVYMVCSLMRVMSPVNLVYLMIIAVLLLKVFMMTIELSALESKVRELVQQIGINEKEQRDEKEERKEIKGGGTA